MGSFDRIRPDVEVPDDAAARIVPPRVERGPEPQPGPDRPTIVERPPPMEIVDREYPGLYDRTECRPPEQTDRHQAPEAWVADRNPGYPDVPGRMTNCGDCARASELTWRGVDTQAGERTDPSSRGEVRAVMDSWSRGERVVSSLDDVQDRLQTMGPGSSALVAVFWKRGGGHWFNAFNDDGLVVAADGQSGLSDPWPPTLSGVGIRPELIEHVEAIFIDNSGRHLPDDHLEQVR